ncbi:tetratricopeptide repeat protein [Bartonella sp. HY406]|uniref:tetratricopeptide repeat protein n=1 Tax=Bartonella sp. HY406 TaxID=2979331 RepID=UPI0021C6BCDE|nr:tetratricopeptide repeat protein [Bartonella sp. HY406]UXN04875.1 sel1 repeat family protein [Bartonella sp. HY406]
MIFRILALLFVTSFVHLATISFAPANQQDEIEQMDNVEEPDAAVMQKLAELEEEAKKGDVVAQFALADFYADGMVIKQDFVKAFFWFQKAAEQGDAYAQNRLALLYVTGQGTNQDDQMALHWFLKSANNGFPASKNNLGRMYEEGIGVAQNFNRAAKWYEEAAKAGSPLGQANLAYMYQQGYGVEKNLQLAYMWAHIAGQNDQNFVGRAQEIENSLNDLQKQQVEKAIQRCLQSNYKSCDL